MFDIETTNNSVSNLEDLTTDDITSIDYTGDKDKLIRSIRSYKWADSVVPSDEDDSEFADYVILFLNPKYTVDDVKHDLYTDHERFKILYSDRENNILRIYFAPEKIPDEVFE